MLRTHYLRWCDDQGIQPLALLEWSETLAGSYNRVTDSRGTYFRSLPTPKPEKKAKATPGKKTERRANTKWTDAERKQAAQLIRDGVESRYCFDLFPGRDKQFVWNLFAEVGRDLRGVCACGAPREEGYKSCGGCRLKAREQRDTLKRQGLCTSCGQPADATLTKCTTCSEYHAKFNPKRMTERQPGGGSGVLRWLSSGSLHNVIEQLPTPISRWQVVDVFGGSGSLSLWARKAGYSVVYNDIHPVLGDVMRAVRDGSVEDLVAQVNTLAVGTPAELLATYTRVAELPPISRAATLFLLAGNVVERDMHRMELFPALRSISKDQVRRLREHAVTLQGVEIQTSDFAEVIRKYDGPNTVFLLDPPYLGAPHFEYNLTVERFQEMGHLLEHIQGRFILSMNSARQAAECVAGHPYAWWRPIRLGPARIRQLTTSNYPLSFERIDLKDFGVRGEVPTAPVQRSGDRAVGRPVQNPQGEKPVSRKPRMANPKSVPVADPKPMVSMVPLSAMLAMHGYKKIANRVVNEKRVAKMVKKWSDIACGMVVLYQATPKSPFLIVSGHHRHAAMLRICADSGIDPANRLVLARICTAADVQASGKSEEEFLSDLIVLCNEQKEQRLAEILQLTQMTSRWGRSLEAIADFDPNKKNGLTFTKVLQAYITAKRCYAAIAEGSSPITVASALRVHASADEMIEVFNDADPEDFDLVVHALRRWTVAATALMNPPKGQKKYNLFSVKVLTFVLLAHLDPENRRLRQRFLTDLPNMFRNPANPWTGFPDKKEPERMAECTDVLLQHVNYRKHGVNRVTVCGLLRTSS